MRPKSTGIIEHILRGDLALNHPHIAEGGEIVDNFRGIWYRIDHGKNEYHTKRKRRFLPDQC